MNNRHIDSSAKEEVGNYQAIKPHEKMLIRISYYYIIVHTFQFLYLIYSYNYSIVNYLSVHSSSPFLTF